MRSDPGRHRRRTIRIQGYDYNQAGAYFVTVVTQNRNCVFGVVKEVRMVEREWKRLSQRFRQVEIMDFVIMPNHLHMIAAGTVSHRLSDTIRDFKHYTASQIIKTLQEANQTGTLTILQQAAAMDERGNIHKVWNEGNHPILVEDEYMFREKLNYLHDNPVRKGFVDQPEHWLYSSARNYILDDHSVLKVECVV